MPPKIIGSQIHVNTRSPLAPKLMLTASASPSLEIVSSPSSCSSFSEQCLDVSVESQSHDRVSLRTTAGWATVLQRIFSRLQVTTRVVLALVALTLGTSLSASAQGTEGAEALGAILGDAIGTYARSYIETKTQSILLSREIEAARQAFAAAHSSGVGVEEARQSFAEALYRKDMEYLALAIPAEMQAQRMSGMGTSTSGANPQFGVSLRVFEIVTGADKIDGGIRDRALNAYGRWVSMYVSGLVERTDAMFFDLTLQDRQDAFDDAFGAYEDYVVVRDIAEYEALGIPFPGTETTSGYITWLLLRAEGIPNWSEVDSVVKNMIEVFGASALEEAVQTVRLAAKSPDGNVRDLASLGLVKGTGEEVPSLGTIPAGKVYTTSADPLHVLNRLLGSGTPRRYALGLLYRDFNRRPDWKVAATRYKAMQIAYDEEATSAAFNRIQAAEKHLGGFTLVNPQALGVTQKQPVAAVEEILATDRKGFLRYAIWASLGGSRTSPTRDEVLTAYIELVEEPGEDAVLETIDDPYVQAVDLQDKIGAIRLIEEFGEDAVLEALDDPYVQAVDLRDKTEAIRYVITGDDGEPQLELSPNPAFEIWANRPLGASSTYRMQHVIQVGEVELTKRRTVRLVGRSDDLIRLRIRTEKEEGSTLWSPDEKPREETVTLPRLTAQGEQLKSTELIYDRPIRLSGSSDEELLVEAGSETVEVGGRPIECGVTEYRSAGGYAIIRACYDDEVPGHLVSLSHHTQGRLEREVTLLSFRNDPPPGGQTNELATESEMPSAEDEAGEAEKPSAQTVAEACPSRLTQIAEEPPSLASGESVGVELMRRVRYPASLRGTGDRGRVFVQFTVGLKGQLLEPRITRGERPAFDREALRAVQSLQFKPGRSGGQPVCVQMSLPVTFDP